MGRLESVTRLAQLGQKETVKFLLRSSRSIHITLSLPKWTDVVGAWVRRILRISIGPTGQSDEKLFSDTKGCRHGRNHVGVFRAQG